MTTQPNPSSPHRSLHSQKEAASPLRADALDYFSETAAKLGTGGSSGVMIQSPDGRPAGIFFHPKPVSRHSSLRSSRSTTRRASFEDQEQMDKTSKSSSLQVSSVAGQGSRSADSELTKFSSSSSNRPTQVADIENGTVFSPKVDLQSILSGNRMPTVKPIVPSNELSQASDSTPAERLSPRSLAAADRAISVQQSQSVTPQSPTGRSTSPSNADDRHSARRSFGAAMAGNTNVARPSAQPQSGLLIGAGFTNPRKKGNVQQKRATDKIEVLPPIKVLIVEDNPINVKILSTFLKQRKIKYGIARDGREAVKEWQTGGYHLILMDIQLPVMDGIEATKEIRKLEQRANIGTLNAQTPSVSSASTDSAANKELGAPQQQESALLKAPDTTMKMADDTQVMLQNSLRSSVIIVALTASVLNSDRVAALAAGCNDFLNKPVDLRWLERKVIEWGSMQYLIGFRELPESYWRRNANRTAAAHLNAMNGRHHLISPADLDRLRAHHSGGGGTVDRRAFTSGPDQMARELAGRLYIGDRSKRHHIHSNSGSGSGTGTKPAPPTAKAV